MTRNFEVLIVGGGPAGIAAAVCAAESGRRVGLLDDNPAPGGQIWRDGQRRAQPRGEESRWRSRLLAAAVTQLQGWSVFDQPQAGILSAERRGELAEFHYQRLIIATGARERFLPFPGWTLPNIMGVGAIQALMKGGFPVEGKRIAIAGSGPLLLAVAASLQSAGAKVLCVCEQASLDRLLPFAISLAGTPSKIAEGLRYKLATWNVPFHASSWPIAAEGDMQLRSVTLSIGGKTTRIDCDYLACGFHLVPNTELPALLGCRMEGGAVAVDEWQQTSQAHVYCAGEPTGIGGLELSLIEGQIAGLSAAARHQAANALFAKRKKLRGFATRLERAFAPRPELKALPQDDTLVCRCEDVPLRAIRQHQSWRSAKLHTRCGMGPCQGRVCGAATEFLFGWSADSPRPPLFPTLLSSLAPQAADRDKHLETTMKA
jgi:NADPH-dependent 2,4-dienoyl-CoA reductase/sulfur reductase-like enzyme